MGPNDDSRLSTDPQGYFSRSLALLGMRSGEETGTRGKATLAVLVLASLILGCKIDSTRPPYGPIEGASDVKVELKAPAATQILAERLLADSLPVTRIELRDGWMETPWFDAATGKPTNQRRLGPEVVRVRAWVDPLEVGHSRLTVETLFRPLADPSVSDRELDRQVPPDHPTAARVDSVLKAMLRQYGDTSAGAGT